MRSGSLLRVKVALIEPLPTLGRDASRMLRYSLHVATEQPVKLGIRDGEGHIAMIRWNLGSSTLETRR